MAKTPAGAMADVDPGVGCGIGPARVDRTAQLGGPRRAALTGRGQR